MHCTAARIRFCARINTMKTQVDSSSRSPLRRTITLTKTSSHCGWCRHLWVWTALDIVWLCMELTTSHEMSTCCVTYPNLQPLLVTVP